MIDTLTLVETPEGINLRLRSAGLMPRSVAWAVDLGIRVAALWVLAMPLGFFGESGQGIYLIVIFLIMWWYPVIFEVLNNGQTLGKRAMGLRVVHANGTPVSWTASFVRNLMRTVDLLPFLYGVGAVSSLVDHSSRRLGDIVAGTLVVHVDKPKRPTAAPHVAPVDVPIVLTQAEKAAILAFAERSRQLTGERQLELASLLPMLTQTRGPKAVERLLGMANAILGRKPA
ncbi:RDD family protein [Tahibacter amnicola]|uniref:RDD family protein n=1 Tax=Tahibacter amnicola TaxID=2976241 RepID=A0ABY6BE63_9GAMM|nr:RDD family protein [Tahibacter amnicola]UXI68034.1 RDD family protein [Tahibacter amnicola]